jgi:transposase
MSAYSLDLREKIVESVKKGVSKAETARRFAVHRATVKHILRKVSARTKETLIEAMGRALGAVSAQDARGFFAHCGYRIPAQQL